ERRIDRVREAAITLVSSEGAEFGLRLRDTPETFQCTMNKVATLDRIHAKLARIHRRRVQSHLGKREKATCSLQLQYTCSTAKIGRGKQRKRHIIGNDLLLDNERGCDGLHEILRRNRGNVELP